MGKYGKKFRKIQIVEWKEKYLNYKEYKQKIKVLVNEKNNKEYLSMNDNEKEKKISGWTFQFEDSLDKDIKKVYIFFSNKERTLYKKINKLLHMKEEYGNFELGDYLEQYKELNDLSILSLNISEFIYYNLKAVMKILKKYDKKIIGPEFKNLHIKMNYIKAKLEEQNSDILYLIKFKMIDEINLISETLIHSLKEQFKLNKDKLNINSQNDVENKLIDEVPEIGQAETLIKQNHETIKKNIKKIDKISAKITTLFLPWKNYLRISSDLSSKLLQITKENSMNESLNTLVKRSIAETINFSKESKYNVLIILSHGFLYMFSYSVIIPAYTSNFLDLKTTDPKHLFKWWGLLMMMTPIGSLFSNFYETSFFRKSTKKPIIISCFGLMIGNILYAFTRKMDCFYLLFICRFIIGLFNLRTHNKMYLLNFLLKKDISFYLTIFHTLSMVGLGFGFLVKTVLIETEMKGESKETLNALNIGPFSAGFLSFCLLVLSFTLFTEAYSKYFNMTSLQTFSEGILNENGDNDENFGETNNIHIDGENIENEVRKQSVLLKGINEQLGNVNRISSFDDTNLVVKSVYELTKQEEGSLNYLFNSFVIYLLIIFTTKLINESIYLNAILYNKKNKENDIEDKFTNIKTRIPTSLGCSCFISLIIELSLSCKDIFISEKNLLIILLFFLTCNSALLILLEYFDKGYFYFFILESIIANLTQKYAAHLFLYIIPENYHLCKIHGNVVINIFSMLSMIIPCNLVFLFKNIEDDSNYKYMILIIMASLSFLSLIFYFIFYQDIRVKAIRRIMKDSTKDVVKISTEV